ncbi:aminodeoxychorismate synthase component I [uncultured Corynebacterium sp.]|uniref:aminodeoxychorismate synthase component I n=1 Tax=uncultured Corynebacterium sp. TaxID=159447 RepID=UPI0026183AA9|nr:aminodeoxychorismate synthase component I [uncultured Corynebacterium sp.]
MSSWPTSVLTRLIANGHRPVALIGSWFGYRAVLAANVELTTCDPAKLFTSPDPDSWTFGFRPYSGTSAHGVAACVALLADDGSWHFDGPGASDPLNPDLQALQDAINHSNENVRDDALPAASPLEWDRGDRDRHQLAVESCKEAIAAGEVYQTCISTRFHAELNAEPEGDIDAFEPALSHAGAWFSSRVTRYQPARAAFLPGNLDAGIPILASLSPEEFLIRAGATVTETPIKGTIPADHSPAELLRSDKDIAENIMIVDLVRHDLGQVAKTGTVKVTDLLSVRPAPGVWHLFSTVSAELPDQLSHAELIEACFPPASVTGTPKLRAIELLREWEPEPRGAHCGAIGASHGDALELNVAIRTAEYAKDPNSGRVRVEAGIGGGITIGSTSEGEWAEIEAKAAPLLLES